MWAYVTPILGYGIFGLGFLLAFIGISVAKSSPSNFRMYMTYAIVVFIAGSFVQYLTFRTKSASDDFQNTWGQVPSEMFGDYVAYRTQTLRGSRLEGIERFDGYLEIDDQVNTIAFAVAGGKCRFYFASGKPPARVAVDIENKDTRSKLIGDTGFWQEGIVCAPSDTKSHDAKAVVRVRKHGGDYVLRLWEALDSDRTANGLFSDEVAPSKAQKATFSKVVCTGEYRENCPVVPDVHIGCPSGRSQQEIEVSACGGSKPTKFEVLATGLGGNRCGYSAFRITCQEN